MDLLGFAKARVRAVLSEIGRLAEAEFPYWHSRAALETLKSLFEKKLERLESFSSTNDPAVVTNECQVTLRATLTYLPFLGFVLRSTNVRNAFELFGPLFRLAVSILEPGVERSKQQTRLLLSSEWLFSPFTFRPISQLPDFLLIGLPAPESANPLVVPVTGHEIGHSVWAKFKLQTQFSSRIETEIVAAILNRWGEYQSHFGTLIPKTDLTTDLGVRETWRPALEWCFAQAEESFCDYLGLRIFGSSYLHSFAYLLAPGFGKRSVEYPEITIRASNLSKAATLWSVPAPTGFTTVFSPDAAPTLSPVDRFELSLADDALEQLHSDLIAEAESKVAAAGVALPTVAEATKVYARMKLVVPAEGCMSFADILNGAWMAHDDPDLWKGDMTTRDRRMVVLKELVLKNLEVFEIEQIQAKK